MTETITVPEWLAALNKLECVIDDPEFITLVALARLWNISIPTASRRIKSYRNNPAFLVESKRIHAACDSGATRVVMGYKITPVASTRPAPLPRKKKP